MFSSSRAISNVNLRALPRCDLNKHVSSLSDQFKEGVKHGESNYRRRDVDFGGGINRMPDQTTLKKGTRNENETTTEDVAGTARDTAGSAADMAKAAAVGVLETGLKLGEMAKETMDGMWDATKKTTESVRDSVADNNNNNNNDDGRERLSGDKYVDDLRRKAGGYDVKGYK